VEFTHVPVDEAVDFGLAHARGEQPPKRLPLRERAGTGGSTAPQLSEDGVALD
jgi:hypothetical protein